MNGVFAYNWHIWPVLASSGLLAALAAYSWRRRAVPGAFAFAVLNTFQTLWVLGAALELVAADLAGKILWTKFQIIWQIPAATASLCFALEYANLGRFLTRRTVTLLAIPPVLLLLLALTNDFHHWEWVGILPGEYIRIRRGFAGQIMLGYGYSLSWMPTLVFVWLFIRSPLHRWPAALCLSGQIVLRIVYLLGVGNVRPFSTAESLPLAFLFLSAMYALALFRFDLFDLIPIARSTMIEQMREGMLILDTRHRIIYLNPAAEKILGIPGVSARGADAQRFLPMRSALHVGKSKPELSGTPLPAPIEAPSSTEFEVHLGTDGVSREYLLHLSSLRDRRGDPLGQLVLLHDVTEQRRAQAQLVEQQRALATLQERVRIARELHDDLGQVLGYVKMQAQAARELLVLGSRQEAERCLEQLVAAAQRTHADVREYIVGANTGMATEAGFLATLRQYLARFSEDCRIRTELNAPPEWIDGLLEPMVEVQLLRIVQEALTNARKHARSASARVSLRLEDGNARITVADDGAGFDVTKPPENAGQHFGLRFMRERAEAVGGSVEVRSEPGKGAQVLVQVPIRKEAYR
jgi:PAS domain S-box-containing protein